MTFQSIPLAPSAPAAPTKRVTMALAADGSGNTTTVSEALQRFAVLLPATTTRWRLRIANPNATGALTISDTYLGDPTYTAGTWAGNMTSPVKALDGATGPADATDWTSAWVTDPALQFTADQLRVLSTAFRCTDGISIWKASNPNRAWYGVNGVGAFADVGIAAPTHGAIGASITLNDIRLEYEAATTLPVVLIVSDSTGIGYMDGPVANVMGPNASWPALAGTRDRFLWVNASVGGKRMSDFTGATRFNRFDLATTPPDIAIINCGINDGVNLVTAASFITSLQSVCTQVKSYGVKRIVVGTVLPQPRWKAGLVTTGQATGSTTLLTSMAYANADVVDVDYGVTGKAETLTVSGASTGVGPYTTTFTTATTKDHSAGATISLQNESLRKDYNNHIRSVPAQVAQVVDFAMALTQPGNPGNIATEYIGVGAIHPGEAGYARMAELVRVRP